VVEAARVCALRGAQLLAVMGANSDPFTLDTICRVRAFENGCHVVYANQQGGAFCGRSVCVAPTGVVLGQSPAEEDDGGRGTGCGGLLVEVAPDDEAFAACRRRNPFFAVRQPTMYTAITDH